MPFAPLWLPRIPDAVAQLEALDRDVITRKDLEQLFGVSRALAAQLMRRFGADRVGSQLVLDRPGLIRTLKTIRRGRQSTAEAARRTAVVTTLRRAHLEAVHVSVPAALMQTHVAGLPSGVAVGPGRIEVRFASVPEALQQLFTLAQAITNDYDRFAAIVSASSNGGGGESTL
jgi:hypothetical protein